MADEQKKNKNIHTSYVGSFKEGSFEKIDDKSATAIFVTAGGQEKVVKGYNDNVATLEAAVAEKGEIIIRGTMLGGKANSHMGIYAVGPERIAGVVSKARDNFETYEKDGKQAYANLWVGVERGEKKIFRAVTAYGDDALALKGVEEGSRIETDARVTHEKRGEEWQEVYVVTGNASFEAAPAKEEEEAPAP